MSEIDRVTEKILAFRNAREWAQFHNPKDLAAGLAIEAAELQEIFLWKAADEVAATAADKRAAISEELADVLWYVLLLAHELGIDPLRAVEQKLELNAAKYPVDKAKGKHTKYTDL